MHNINLEDYYGNSIRFNLENHNYIYINYEFLLNV